MPITTIGPRSRILRCGASIDRLVHHATTLEMNVESYRRRAALDRKRAKKTELSET